MESVGSLDRVLEIVRGLAEESGGRRARDSVSPHASLEREIGLGSLERVELLLRLENATGRELDESHLRLDTAADLARALVGARASTEPRLLPHDAPTPAPRADLRLPPDVRTLSAALAFRARAEPSRTHVFLRGARGLEATLTYGELWHAARGVARGLESAGVTRGQRVALVLPTGLDFLSAFMGIGLAGGVPVPLYPPLRLDRLGEYAQRQSAILQDSGVSALVTLEEALPLAGFLGSRVPGLATVTTAAHLRRSAPGTCLDIPASETALIQYTSGSTNAPKGVVLSHTNVVANIEAIAAGVDLRPSDVGASWLPLYHDMGLIGSWLFCLWHGIPLALLPPNVFLARPDAWLCAIHEHRATLSAAPNFAYELCARRVQDAMIDTLDLSSWRVAMNGAEPVSPGTLARFARRFARAGFRSEALMPVYGLAESSVALCFPPLDRGPRLDRIDRDAFSSDGAAQSAPPGDETALVFVSAGTALPAHEVRVADDEGRTLAERLVGRVLFRGPSATCGYLGKSDSGLHQDGGFLDSGDLGYIADGELFVTGRRKDLIIVGGRNVVPQEVEEAASAVEGVRKGCVAAFGLRREETGSEALVVLAETRLDVSEHDRLATEITARVADLVGLPPERVVMVSPGTVPRTSSGKIRRQAARELLTSGRLGSAQSLRPADAAELALRGATNWIERRVLVPLGRLAYGAWTAIVLSALCLPAWALLKLVPSRSLAFALGRVVSRVGLRAIGCRVEASGLQHVPPTGPLVLVANHASYIDAIVLAAVLPRNFLFLAKREALKMPVIGAYLARARHLTVSRWDAERSIDAANEAAAALAKGEAVLFFPEATFTSADGLRPFRAGAFKVALDAGVPVVPIALRGTRLVLRGDWGLPRPGRVAVVVGQPLHPAGQGWPALVALRDRTSNLIAKHCGEARLDMVSAGPATPPA